MQAELSGVTVVFTVKSGGAIRYDFEALSKARKPVVYAFTGTVETYMFDREDTGYVSFSYAKKDGGGAFRWASSAARERWAHVVKFIRSEVVPAAREFSKTAEYQAELTGAIRGSLVASRKEAERNVERARVCLAEAEDELVLATSRLALFDERRGTPVE